MTNAIATLKVQMQHRMYLMTLQNAASLRSRTGPASRLINALKLSAFSPRTARRPGPETRHEGSIVRPGKDQSTPRRLLAMSFIVIEDRGLTMQQKHPVCHSAPNAFTTVSVTGFRHFLHLVLYRCV